ncbi:ORF6N domain-containing protein [Candidatus Marinarcus aquaticus]|uniref:DNA-binding protein n=1 Tax=Candidatus Marinarcus aquaticus TaxID=2044504 RepID=A0A4Q0XRF8_9BACT|nr:ORF6N domain-containing protein [Candidatus Marinarcus aquaticus]RXJ54579.1 DNA-binding protein [Candidatus Marinarcus aquaticus]
MENHSKILHQTIVDDKIFIIRGIQVMIDRDLAELYEVETKVLNQAVKRNSDSFPSDFMFRLSNEEKNELVTTCDRLEKIKHSTSNPLAFTEQGVYMLATVLKSKIAREVNISIMRTFTRLKNQSVPYFDIIKRLEKLETEDNKTKELLRSVVQVINSMQELQDEAKDKTKKIGFLRE